MTIGLNRITGARVVRLVTQETGTYNQQYSRPYNTVMDGDVLKLIGNKLESSPNKVVNANTFAGITSSFMAPQAAPDGNVNIVNGWNSKRIRFILTIEFSAQLSGKQTHYILGYTDFPGISHSGHFAPDMVFYINSIVQTKKSYVHTPMGVREVETVSDASQILAENNFTNIYNPVQRYTMRPEDIVTGMATSHLVSGYNDDDINYEAAVVHNTGAMLRQEAMKSRRSNNLASTYVANLINGLTRGIQSNHFGDPDSPNSDIKTLEVARSHLLDPTAPIDPFLHMLSGITNRVAGNSFTFGQLTQFDPNVDNVSNHFIVPPAQIGSIHQAGSTSHWNGSDISTQAAAILSQSVPAIMMDMLVSKVVFVSTNHVVGSQPHTNITYGASFSNSEEALNWQMFAARLEREVLSNITFNFSMGYRVEMHVDLLGETFIQIQIGSNGTYDYMAPSFCDNLLTPVVTTQRNLASEVSHEFENLFDQIKEQFNPGMKSYDFHTNPII